MLIWAELPPLQAHDQAQELMNRMRSEIANGHVQLVKAKNKYRERTRGRLHDCRSGGSGSDFDQNPADQSGCGLREARDEGRGASLSECAELAFESLVRAVNACQSLELRGGTLPRGLSDTSGLPVRVAKDGNPPAQVHVMEDEQVQLHCLGLWL